MDESEFEKEKKDILNYKFDINNGPLWCIRMFPSTIDDCLMPDVKNKFPHQYNILYGIHHIVTDGTSNVSICNWFLEFLNDVIGKRHIDDDKQLGFHVYDELWEDIHIQVEEEMTGNSKRFVKAKAYYDAYGSIPYNLDQVFPLPKIEPGEMDCVEHDFTAEETQKILTTCRAHGITLNSFMTIATVASIIDLIKQKVPKEKWCNEYNIPNWQLVNIRRYLKGFKLKPLGATAVPFSVVSKAPLDISNAKFWELAKEFDTEFKERMNNYGPFEEDLYYKMANIDHFEVFLSEDPLAFNQCFFTMSNMGNFDKLFPGTGDHVQATRICRMTGLKSLNGMMELHSFRGQFLFAIDYNTFYLSREQVNTWMKAILKVVNEKLEA